ncbi:MAG: CoA transferase [Proteobacteria bacterium]|nr:CoA transferase [Pseudomonadota bacterium]
MRATGGPLEGIKVLDASAGAVGPWAGSLLGQLGADVVKIEPPQGDFIRNIMPTQRGLSTTYISMNYSKRSILLDLKDAAERAKAHGLIKKADVFIENFRPGVAERLGLGHAELSALNPRLIYASASGFGWGGPMVKIGATDPHIQAFSGAASVNGMPGGLRQRMRWYGHFDVNTALCIVQAILTALFERARTGRGRRVEITMIEAALALQRLRIAEHLAGGRPAPMGSATTYLVPDQAFPAQDGPIAVSATSRRQWERLCAALGKPELAEDARFRTNPLRVRNREALIPILESVFRTRPACHWLRVLAGAAVPAAEFTSFHHYRHHVHYLENEMLATFDTHWGRMTVAGIPWRFDKSPASLRPAAAPGEHTEEIVAGDWPDLAPAAGGAGKRRVG